MARWRDGADGGDGDSDAVSSCGSHGEPQPRSSHGGVRRAVTTVPVATEASAMAAVMAAAMAVAMAAAMALMAATMAVAMAVAVATMAVAMAVGVAVATAAGAMPMAVVAMAMAEAAMAMAMVVAMLPSEIVSILLPLDRSRSGGSAIGGSNPECAVVSCSHASHQDMNMKSPAHSDGCNDAAAMAASMDAAMAASMNATTAVMAAATTVAVMMAMVASQRQHDCTRQLRWRWRALQWTGLARQRCCARASRVIDSQYAAPRSTCARARARYHLDLGLHLWQPASPSD